MQASGNGSDSRPEVRWGLGDVLAGLGIVFGLQAVVVLVVSVLGVDVAGAPRWFVLLGLVTGWVGLGVWPVLVARLKGTGPRRDFGLAVEGSDVLVGTLTALGLLVVIYVIELGVAEDPVRRPSVELLVPTDPGAHLLHTALVVVGVVLITPVVEELFFRGLVLRAGERRWGTVFGVGLSTVLFALLHLEPGVVAGARLLLQIGALGIAFALLAVRTGRLGAPIAAHVVVNAVGVTAAFAAG